MENRKIKIVINLSYILYNKYYIIFLQNYKEIINNILEYIQYYNFELRKN